MNISNEMTDYLQNIRRVVQFVERTGRMDVLETNRERLEEWVVGASSLCEEPEMENTLKELLTAVRDSVYEDVLSLSSELLSAGTSTKTGEKKEVKVKKGSPERGRGDMDLQSSVRYLKGVGKVRASALERLGVETVYDLFMLFPRDYEDRREITRVEDIIPGERYTVLARILEVVPERLSSGKERLRVTATDGTGRFMINFWGMTYLADKLGRGEMLRIYGKAEIYDKYIQFNNPEFDSGEEFDGINYGRIVPVYPLTEGLNQKQVRKIVYNAISKYSGSFASLIPPGVLSDELVHIKKAVQTVHFPEEMADIEKSMRRLALEQIFLVQVAIALRRQEYTDVKGLRIRSNGDLRMEFLQTLHFELTGAQERVISEILEDLSSDSPMHRLLQGDVGCGKTVVAVATAMDVVEEGHQVVIMAPTEILARQHYRRLNDMLSPLNIKVELLIGGQDADRRREVLDGVSTGEVDIVVGTHALIEEGVKFDDLGLVIIDEQHKFGVHQRTRLIGKGEGINLLVMTATPIPRTIALAVYGDLDISVIDEMPAGRKKIDTSVYADCDREEALDRVEEHLRDKEQGFIVYPLIEESDKLDARAIERDYIEHSEERFSDFKVEMIHGRLDREEQKKIIEGFERGDIDLLLTTTVAEVGIDIKGATFIMIENAERFGLSQLHQLRGRTGRGGQKAFCYLIIGDGATELAEERVSILAETDDGFRIAEEDLRLRGPGEFLGVKQSGVPDYVLNFMMKYPDLINMAREMAGEVLEGDPQLEKKEQKVLKEHLLSEFRDKQGITFSG